MMGAWRNVVVADAQMVTPRVRCLTLRPLDGPLLPAWSAGSHIGVRLSDGGRSWLNTYSLVGEPGETQSYRIAVRREDEARSKGGSIHVHEQVQIGDQLEIGAPANHFPLARHAKRHLLIAGGIGITPFLSQLAALKKSGQPYELHYGFRSRLDGAFCDAICAEHGGYARFYISEEGQRMDVSALVERQPLGTHVYVCGPRSLIDAVRKAAADAGWPTSHVHFEEFAAPPLTDAVPFEVRLPQNGLQFAVGAQETLLEAMERAGVPVSSSCRVGMCGTCEMRVLDGVPEHRDRCLSESEIAEGKMIACVSRTRGGSLVLALPE